MGEPADRPEPAAVESTESTGLWNVATPTLGGMQFWADQTWFRGWRIQRNVFTGHCRLLDPSSCRHAWGTYDQCQSALRQVKQASGLRPLQGKAVVLVHGLIRSSGSFAAMEKALSGEGYEVVRFDYPSTRVPIQESAESLNRVIAGLEGIDEINFVVHSMGGLVVRQSLATGKDPRIGRLVMLGVPNHGANLANMLKDYTLFKTIYGPAGQQLVEDSAGFIAGLPTPDFPFAVVAGGRGTPAGYNPWIAGDDDGTVAVSSTRLPGAADFMTVPTLHSFLMSDPAVIASTTRFLKSGRLSADTAANPIPVLPSPAGDSIRSTVTPASPEGDLPVNSRP
ncbi:MAG TPA: alpha/beta fold hydrolase [Caulifigura sp.]|nr:alpha/beta fold hydrolase [Caulifigura sp.]